MNNIKTPEEMHAEAMFRICNMPFDKSVAKAFCENGEVMMTLHGKIQTLDANAKGLVDLINSLGGELIYHVIVEEFNGLRIYFMFIVSIDADDWKHERYKHDRLPIRMMINMPYAIDYDYIDKYVKFHNHVPYLVHWNSLG